MPCHCQVRSQFFRHNFGRSAQRQQHCATCGLHLYQQIFVSSTVHGKKDVTETASSATQTSRPKVRVPACFNEPRRFPVFSVQLQINSSNSCIIKLDNIACSVRGAHTISLGKGVNYFPSLSKHGRPSSISQVGLWVTYPGLNSSQMV